MKKLNSKGFGHVEILLVILILTVLGTVTYLVKSKSDDKKTESTAVVSTSATPAIPTTTEKKTSDETIKYLSVTQWSVKGVNASSYKLSYSIEKNGSLEYARFNSEELTAKGDACDDAGAGGTITRSSETSEGAKKIGNYYYYFSRGNGTCGPDASYELQLKTYDAVEAIFNTLVSN